MKSQPFARARAMLAALSAFAATAFSANALPPDSNYVSRGKGEGLPHNKRARSSFKQNKRRGL